MTKMYKTAFKSNTNNTVLSGGTVTPLPEANGRTNTALGYKQTHVGGGPIQPKNNNMMMPSPNGAGGMGPNILAASNNIPVGSVQSRHSDRRDSAQLVNGFRQNHQRKPQLSIDYQTIFSAGSPNVSGAGLNITELYSQYANNPNNSKVGGQLIVPGNISSTNANNPQISMGYSNGKAAGPMGSSGQGMISQSPNGVNNGPNAQLFIPQEMKMAAMEGGSIGMGAPNSKKVSMSSQQQPRSQSVVTPGNGV